MGLHARILICAFAQVNMASVHRWKTPGRNKTAMTAGAVFFAKANGEDFFRWTAS